MKILQNPPKTVQKKHSESYKSISNLICPRAPVYIVVLSYLTAFLILPPSISSMLHNPSHRATGSPHTRRPFSRQADQIRPCVLVVGLLVARKSHDSINKYISNLKLNSLIYGFGAMNASVTPTWMWRGFVSLNFCSAIASVQPFTNSIFVVWFNRMVRFFLNEQEFLRITSSYDNTSSKLHRSESSSRNLKW